MAYPQSPIGGGHRRKHAIWRHRIGPWTDRLLARWPRCVSFKHSIQISFFIFLMCSTFLLLHVGFRHPVQITYTSIRYPVLYYLFDMFWYCFLILLIGFPSPSRILLQVDCPMFGRGEGMDTCIYCCHLPHRMQWDWSCRPVNHGEAEAFVQSAGQSLDDSLPCDWVILQIVFLVFKNDWVILKTFFVFNKWLVG